MLVPEYTAKFERDIKRLKKKRYDIALLKTVVTLIVDNSEQAKAVLRQRYKAHLLKGNWQGAWECHVANMGDWLLVWVVRGDTVIFLRTGSHDELFSK